ncbi:MAG: nucleoid occlusion factor SlmA [Gammaproteobacteria bacterium]|nr:MAG: nucleoid occlusion factor SlmA [Gammaproteobacteria bacterium]
MNKAGNKISRREQILSALAKSLEDSPGERITTAALAKVVGVSEAALYRHFPSKTKMFEGLIEYIEANVFTEITLVLASEKSAAKRCELIINTLLVFAEQHPGMSRLLVGDALTGETERLRQRIVQFFERIETQLKQILRDAELKNNLQSALPAAAFAHFLMAYVDGAILQYVRSKFQSSPSLLWLEQWKLLAPLLMQIEFVEA